MARLGLVILAIVSVIIMGPIVFFCTAAVFGAIYGGAINLAGMIIVIGIAMAIGSLLVAKRLRYLPFVAVPIAMVGVPVDIGLAIVAGLALRITLNQGSIEPYRDPRFILLCLVFLGLTILFLSFAVMALIVTGKRIYRIQIPKGQSK